MKPIGTAAKGRLVTLGAALALGALLAGIAVHARAASAGPAAVLTWVKSSNSLNGSVEIAKLNGSDVRTLGPGTSATVAPDGLSVAVVESLPPADNATSELLVYPASGGAVATIASGAIDGASFAPNRSDDVVYALGSSQLLTAPVNVFTTSPTGT